MSKEYPISTQHCQGHQQQGRFEKLSEPRGVYGDNDD
jgi:hypothetical protein